MTEANLHPRLKYYPYHQDYMNMVNEYRPFVLAVGQPNYRSKSVNLDRLGLREQYDSNGRFISLETLKYDYQRCNVIVGASTVFGVDATSDKTTISAFLTEDGVPCINFGVRGALSQQELILFHQLKRLLPPIDNIVLLTGINNCSLGFTSDAIFYPDYGGVFSEQYYYNTFYEELQNQYILLYNPPIKGDFTRKRFLEWVNTNIYNRFAAVRRWANRRFEAEYAPPPFKPVIPTEPKFEMMMDFARNDIQTWGCIQQGLKALDGSNTRVHFVLQPCLGWTQKPLTKIETILFEADLEWIPSLAEYANEAVYQTCRDSYKQSCDAAGIDFYDANEWLNNPELASTEIFVDMCHLSDDGNQILARLIRQHLAWNTGSAQVSTSDVSMKKEGVTVCSR